MFNCKKTAAFIAGLILCASSAASPVISYAAIDGASVEADDGTEITTAAEEEDLKTSGDFKYSLTSEGNICIEDCTSTAESLVIPDTIEGKKVTELGKTALGQDHESNPYTTVTIPASIEYISSDNPFMYCTKLKEIKVDSGNTEYTSVDGVLYSKDKTALICYPCRKEGDSYTIPEGVTTIGFASLYNTPLSSVSFPTSLETIGAFAFGDMIYIKSVDLSKTVIKAIPNYAFSHCSIMEEILLPDTLEAIGGGAFSGCSLLEDITLPESLTSIGQYAFVDTGLDTIIIPDSVQDIGYSAFGYRSSEYGGIIPMNDFTLVGKTGGAAYKYSTDSDTDYDYKNDFTFLTREQYTQEKELLDLETISSGDYTYALKNNTTLLISCRAADKTVTVPSEIDGHTITVVYPGCFTPCQAEEIILPDTVNEIRESAFLQCPELKNLVIPESVKKIGQAAFAECAKLETIEFKGAETIGQAVFSGCGALKKITAAGCLKEWQDDEPFVYCPLLEEISIGEGDGNYSSKDGILYSKDKSSLLCYPANKSGDSFTVPDSVKEIGISAFLNNKNLKNVKMSNVERILTYAFEGCSNLSSVEVSEKLTLMDADAFYNCTSLKSLRLYENLKTIGTCAFGYCKDHSSDADTNTSEDSEDSDTSKDIIVEGFKLYAPENSEAYKYAKNNGIEVIVNTTEVFGKNMDTRFLYALIGIISAAVLTVIGILIGKGVKKKKAAADKARRKEKAAELRSKKQEEEADEDEDADDEEYEDDDEEEVSDED